MTDLDLLDNFAGEGGAGMGYSRAGFKVWAVDNDPKRLALNPFPSHLGDVIDVMATLLACGAVDFTHKDGRVTWKRLSDFAAIHNSPTCTGYSRGTVALPNRLTRYDRLIAITRALMVEAGLPYVIENVEGAKRELDHPIMLCGRMFGLGAIDTDGTPLVLDRHRLFESSAFLLAPPHETHDRRAQVAGLYGGARRDKEAARNVRHGGYVPADLEVQRTLGGTTWASEKGCWLAIPPAYTEFIGAQLLAAITEERAA